MYLSKIETQYSTTVYSFDVHSLNSSITCHETLNKHANTMFDLSIESPITPSINKNKNRIVKTIYGFDVLRYHGFNCCRMIQFSASDITTNDFYCPSILHKFVFLSIKDYNYIDCTKDNLYKEEIFRRIIWKR